VSKDLLAVVRSLPCLHCAKQPAGHAHHVKTRKSGGGDEAENLMPLCPAGHHEVHTIGLTSFAEKHGAVKHWLELAGWEIMDGKWRRGENHDRCD
jgi:5-methylcytosine-specific restriction endonuclease McrA